MLNEIKNMMLAAVGSAAYTCEKASNLIDEMVKKGKITVDEGKQLSEELKRNLTKNNCENNSSKALTKEDLIEVLNSMNFATKVEIEDIKERLNKLEQMSNK